MTNRPRYRKYLNSRVEHTTIGELHEIPIKLWTRIDPVERAWVLL